MHKLVILIHALEDENKFDELWPQFLHWAEQMPGLKSESSGRVAHQIDKNTPIVMLHELFFEDMVSAQQAMNSVSGRKAGQILQLISSGNMTLFLADHHEDTIENILRAKLSNPPKSISPLGRKPEFVVPERNRPAEEPEEDVPNEDTPDEDA